jgi:hypothetical protein
MKVPLSSSIHPRSHIEWRKRFEKNKTGVLLISLILFWAVLLLKIPPAFSRYFHAYSPGLFLVVLISYYLAFRLPDRFQIPVSLGLTMLLFALPLSHLWTSGFSDNFIIGGLLPYKDGKNYYLGANLILNGLPVVGAGQATERPLFPGLLSALLMLTGQNLKIALAIVSQLIGIGVYLSSQQIRNAMSISAASLFGTLMFFYIHSLSGYTLSELTGFMLGCFAFILIFRASKSLNWFDLALGLFALLTAVSARAGAFFIFPLMALWMGWVNRGTRRFSMKTTIYAIIFIAIGYSLVNSVYSRLLGIPSGSAFGNFSYAIYGQVRGGTGWHSAIEELGTRDPSIVYRAALDFFLEHPISLFIGFAKSYRDFFLPGGWSIFPFGYGWQDWRNIVVWLGIMTLLIVGLVQLLKGVRANLPSMLTAGFIGILLSIPFLPPIDGGARFHASTMPFFFAVPAIGISWFLRDGRQREMPDSGLQGGLGTARFITAILLALTLIAPPVIQALSQKPAYNQPLCPTQQKPFAMEFHSGSYVDLVKDASTRCGVVPEVCLSDFEENNTEKMIDDFYQKIISLTNDSDANVRIIPAIDLIGEKFHYFYISHDKLPDVSSFGLISGCATEIETKNQSIYQVESISRHGN